MDKQNTLIKVHKNENFELILYVKFHVETFKQLK